MRVVRADVKESVSAFVGLLVVWVGVYTCTRWVEHSTAYLDDTKAKLAELENLKKGLPPPGDVVASGPYVEITLDPGQQSKWFDRPNDVHSWSWSTSGAIEAEGRGQNGSERVETNRYGTFSIKLDKIRFRNSRSKPVAVKLYDGRLGPTERTRFGIMKMVTLDRNWSDWYTRPKNAKYFWADSGSNNHITDYVECEFECADGSKEVRQLWEDQEGEDQKKDFRRIRCRATGILPETIYFHYGEPGATMK